MMVIISCVEKKKMYGSKRKVHRDILFSPSRCDFFLSQGEAVPQQVPNSMSCARVGLEGTKTAGNAQGHKDGGGHAVHEKRGTPTGADRVLRRPLQNCADGSRHWQTAFVSFTDNESEGNDSIRASLR